MGKTQGEGGLQRGGRHGAPYHALRHVHLGPVLALQMLQKNGEMAAEGEYLELRSRRRSLANTQM